MAYFHKTIEFACSKVRQFKLYSFDLGIVFFSPFVATVIRANFQFNEQQLINVIPYSLIGVFIASASFLVAGTHRSIWRHVSLRDFMRIIIVALFIVLITSSATFLINRLEDIPRSLPLIQLALIISAMSSLRIAVRMWYRPRKSQTVSDIISNKNHVLIIGMNHVAALYLRCVAELASERISVSGILDETPELKGRLLHHHKVLGQPVELPQILAQLNVHGVEISRIVVAIRFDELSKESRETLLSWERRGTVKLDLFEERLGFRAPLKPAEIVSDEATPQEKVSANSTVQGIDKKIGIYTYVKRGIDVAGAIILLVVLSPFLLATSVLVAIDLGFPLIFWQQRPGRHGVPFKLYKFRTMKPGHDDFGNRIPDENRETKTGRFLRRTRMDEFPQLYNVIFGEMSFVGPRPLLPVDLPSSRQELIERRNLICPGITGWAQVNGGKQISDEDKMVLDVWYCENMSLWLDIGVVLRTLAVMVMGENLSVSAVDMAKKELGFALSDGYDRGRSQSKEPIQ